MESIELTILGSTGAHKRAYPDEAVVLLAHNSAAQARPGTATHSVSLPDTAFTHGHPTTASRSPPLATPTQR
jgi:hypothetical protein